MITKNAEQNNIWGRSSILALLHGQIATCRAGRRKEYSNVNCGTGKKEEGV